MDDNWQLLIDAAGDAQRAWEWLTRIQQKMRKLADAGGMTTVKQLMDDVATGVTMRENSDRCVVCAVYVLLAMSIIESVGSMSTGEEVYRL